MQVGLIADIHGNVKALKVALRALARHRVERILVAGDIIGYYPWANEVIELLRSQPITAVLGNHESYLLGRLPASDERWRSYQLDRVDRAITRENRVWLSELAADHCVELGGLRLHLCHGSPWAVDEYVYPDYRAWERFSRLDVDMVILGHTHIPLLRQEGKVQVVNPGSCGQPRDYQPGTCYGVLDTLERKISLHRVEYDLKPLIESLESMEYPRELIEILSRRQRRKAIRERQQDL